VPRHFVNEFCRFLFHEFFPKEAGHRFSGDSSPILRRVSYLCIYTGRYHNFFGPNLMSNYQSAILSRASVAAYFSCKDPLHSLTHIFEHEHSSSGGLPGPGQKMLTQFFIFYF
jgi:hypothetical protein